MSEIVRRMKIERGFGGQDIIQDDYFKRRFRIF